jgi:hypothetical protein
MLMKRVHIWKDMLFIRFGGHAGVAEVCVVNMLGNKATRLTTPDVHFLWVLLGLRLLGGLLAAPAHCGMSPGILFLGHVDFPSVRLTDYLMAFFKAFFAASGVPALTLILILVSDFDGFLIPDILSP